MRKPALQPRSAGFSLVEVMVSIVIALILLAGIVQLFISNKQGYRLQEGFSQMNESARFAYAQMQYHLRMSDHWGGVSPDNIDTSLAPAIASDCSAGFATDNIGLRGYEGGNNVPAELNSCIAAGDYVADSDIIVMRYGGTPPRPIITNDLDGDRLYLRVSAGRRGQIFKGDSTGSLSSDLDDPSPGLIEPYNIQNYPYEFVAYFVRPCSQQSAGTAGVCDDADDDLPTLVRLRLDDTALVQEDVAQGVEQMQILYGLDTNNNLNADTYIAAEDMNNNDWPAVVSVRLDMLIRSPERDMARDTSDANNQYRLAGPPFNNADTPYTVPAEARSFNRRVFSNVIQIRNQSRN